MYEGSIEFSFISVIQKIVIKLKKKVKVFKLFLFITMVIIFPTGELGNSGSLVNFFQEQIYQLAQTIES